MNQQSEPFWRVSSKTFHFLNGSIAKNINTLLKRAGKTLFPAIIRTTPGTQSNQLKNSFFSVSCAYGLKVRNHEREKNNGR